MLYSFKRGQVLPLLSSAGPLDFMESDSPELLAAIGGTSVEEAEIRFRNSNKAYVALWNGKPSAFGWVATDWSRVGELDHKFVLPNKHYYLWNFRTFAEHRGKGIYPRLLQHPYFGNE